MYLVLATCQECKKEFGYERKRNSGRHKTLCPPCRAAQPPYQRKSRKVVRLEPSVREQRLEEIKATLAGRYTDARVAIEVATGALRMGHVAEALAALEATRE